MSKKPKQKISYVLKPQTTSHICGINSIEYKNSILYTGSRDSTIKSWSNRQLTGTFEYHSDWVNDLLIFHDRIVSCSSDKTILLWDDVPVRIGFHNDFVKRLANLNGYICSGGFDQRICLWDIARPDPVLMLSNNNSVNGSIYALSCSDSLICSGSPDKVVRLWDPKSNSEAITLIGHNEAIRDVYITRNGKYVLSASSDATIKLWSTAAPNRCIQTWTQAEDSVFCLYSPSDELSTFYAGVRDGSVLKFVGKDCVLVAKEKNPISRIKVVDDTIITASTSSHLNFYKNFDSLPLESICCEQIENEDITESSPTPFKSKPDDIILGGDSIIKYHLLNDKQRVVTLDTSGKAALWNIVTCKCEKESNDFEKLIQEHNTMEWIAPWCIIDTKIGALTISIEQGKCIDSEIYYEDLNLDRKCENDDQRITIVRWVLTYLFLDYFKTFSEDFKIRDKSPLSLEAISFSETPLTSLPSDLKRQNTPSQKSPSAMSFILKRFSGKSSPVISAEPESIVEPKFTLNLDETPYIEIPNVTLMIAIDDMNEFTCKKNELKDNIPVLTKLFPQWIFNWLILDQPITKDAAKLSFQLLPFDSSLAELPKDTARLTGNRMLRIKKVKLFLAEKLGLKLDPNCLSDNNQFEKDAVYIEILCNQTVLNSRQTLATAKQFIWKSGGDILLHYRQIKDI